MVPDHLEQPRVPRQPVIDGTYRVGLEVRELAIAGRIAVIFRRNGTGRWDQVVNVWQRLEGEAEAGTTNVASEASDDHRAAEQRLLLRWDLSAPPCPPER